MNKGKLKAPAATAAGAAIDEHLDRETWISGQRQAFQLALEDFPLTESLGVLIDTATNALGPGTRGAFYLNEISTNTLRHVVGMTDEFSGKLDGSEIWSGTRGGSAMAAEATVEALWKPWASLAGQHGYQGCWSFPITSRAGQFVGVFALYWTEPRQTTPHDIERANLITQTAAIIISRHNETEERKRAEAALRETQSQLKKELEDNELLRQISLELVAEGEEDSIYQKLVVAAAKIMHSDVCTVQFFHPERGPAGELEMLASTGLNEEGRDYWKWVRGDSGCTCGDVLRTGRRAIAEEVATCSFMAGTPDRDVLLSGGIQAGQSTPLVTRNGKLVGMISTHWGSPHRPSERELRMLDIIARPTADLIERRRAAETQKLLLNELNHRVKNTLAVVQAMATRTLASTSDPKEFSKKFGGRVQALARIHDLLSAKSWHGADLRDLIGQQVAAGTADEARLVLDGPPVQLNPQMALHVALIAHELGTNATKYGALSNAAGRVTVTWSVSDALNIRWTERGGPRVEASGKQGFGTTLISQSARGQGGDATMTAMSEGVMWDIALPYTCKQSKRQSLGQSQPDIKAGRDVDASSLKGRRVLVVEDEPLIGLDIMAALEDAGAIAEGPVSTIAEALEIIERSSFDAALVDANLHGKPVDAIAAALVGRGVSFAFATGYGRDGLPDVYREVPILSKPCSPEQVVEMTARLVSGGSPRI